MHDECGEIHYGSRLYNSLVLGEIRPRRDSGHYWLSAIWRTQDKARGDRRPETGGGLVFCQWENLHHLAAHAAEASQHCKFWTHSYFPDAQRLWSLQEQNDAHNCPGAFSCKLQIGSRWGCSDGGLGLYWTDCRVQNDFPKFTTLADARLCLQRKSSSGAGASQPCSEAFSGQLKRD